MVHVKVLVVVLCSSCFVQDALSAQAEPKLLSGMTQRQASGKLAVPAKVAAVPLKVAAATKQVATAPAKAETVAAKAAAAPRQQAAAGKTARRTITRRRAAAAPPPPPPPKYPALNELKNAFWDSAERLNQANESGKLAARAARNAMSGVLTNPAFWTAAAAVAGKLAKWTNDERKAELRVRMCDAATDLLTRPGATDDYERAAGQAYQAVASVDLAPYVGPAQDAVDAVEHDDVLRALAAARRAVEAVQLDPAAVTKAFNIVNKLLGDGVTNGVAKLGMALVNRQANKR